MSKKIQIPKEELYQKYIIENMPRKDCASYFSVSEKVIIRRLSDYGFRRDPKMTNINRESTMLKRYGVKHPSQNETLKEKARKTMINRYGVEYTAQSPALQEKMQNTMMQKYHKNYYVETNEFQNKSQETCLNKHGVKHPCEFPQCIKALEDCIGHSKPEQEFADLLKKYDIEYEQEFPIRGFKYDFRIKSTNILFEINPSSTHNSTFGLFGKEPKEKMYHFIKHSVAKEYGFHCIHVFDWDNKEKIIRIFLLSNKVNERVYARNCEVRDVSEKEAKQFLNMYHLQDYAKSSINLGLYEKKGENNELVEIMTFDKPRYNSKYEYELVRLCSKKNVVGGTEKILNEFVKRYQPRSIISYCDLAKFDGNIYQKLGFRSINKPKPSKHWVNLKTGQHITDNLLRQKGFDQLFKTNYGKGTSNDVLMRENGFVEVYDCGQLAFAKEYK